ncbi:hypothetical protein D9619_008799 [Psilocybe cf. subviscida]|uniref:Uncharacterized protein n=1 Tax=Psilocybe cf. subviscida TaxID=2480587 RepID=A0A8H5F0R6_9AGAR|nr:hypothetical protein D9619_008799 [Psilocybe cf. subviscida]
MLIESKVGLAVGKLPLRKTEAASEVAKELVEQRKTAVQKDMVTKEPRLVDRVIKISDQARLFRNTARYARGCLSSVHEDGKDRRSGREDW